MSETPRFIRVHPDDNVAIVVNDGGLPAGTRFDAGLTLHEHVPQGHKVNLVDLAEGAPILRYGQVIGLAARDIPAGSWIEESLVRLPPAPALAELKVPGKGPAHLPSLEGYTFEGYRNADGSVGTRNLLAISTSVQCVAGVADYAARRIREEMLPHYSNVDGIVPLTHTYGCGVAINAPGAAVPIRSLHNLARNANFGGEPMVLGLGCEKLYPEWILEEGRPKPAPGNTPDIVRLQDESQVGFESMIATILEQAEKRLKVLNARTRTTCPASDLVVGMQCGGSDAFSGVTSNPAIGFASDLIVRCGGTVMFSEVTEVRDAIHMLVPRAATPEVGQALIREMAWYDEYLNEGSADRAANTTPGNKRGGLANIVEKALGSVAKSGSAPIDDVLSPGERPHRKGLIFAATPASDFICGTQQLASGITLQVFSTGRGTPYGLAAIPVIKMSSRTNLAKRWHDLIDIDAGRIATGQASIEEVGWELFRLILDVASGRKQVWADHWGLHNDLAVFNPGPVT